MGIIKNISSFIFSSTFSRSNKIGNNSPLHSNSNSLNSKFATTLKKRIKDNVNYKLLLKKYIILVYCCTKFLKISKKLKLYGTSSINLNLNYRNKNFILKAITINKLKSIKEEMKKIDNLVNPQNKFFTYWNLLMLIFIIYSIILMPYFMVFEADNIIVNNCELIMNIFFLIDIVINFNTAVIENNLIIIDRKVIAIKYLKSFFFIDLVSSIPLEILLGNTSSINKLLRFLKIPKLIRIFKMSKLSIFEKIFEKYDRVAYYFRIRMGFLKIIKIFVITFILLHLASCLLCYISYNKSTTSWIIAKQLQNKSDIEIYLRSLYFCIVTLTTLGYGDIVPVTIEEFIFTIIWMMVGVTFYSFTIGIITAFFQNRVTKKTLLNDKILYVENFCINNKIEKQLKKQIINSLKYSASKISYLWLPKELNFIKDLPFDLKYEFLTEVYKDVIDTNIFLKNKEPSFIISFLPLLKPIQYKKNEVLWNNKDIANKIVFLVSGEVDFYCENVFFLNKINQRIGSTNLKKLITSSLYNNKTSLNAFNKTIKHKGLCYIITNL